MKTIIVIACVAFVLVSCDQKSIPKSEINLLINNQVKENEEILKTMNEFIETHGQKGFEGQFQLVNDFQNTHDEIISFMQLIDSIEDKNLSTASSNFIQETFAWESSIPKSVMITETTSRELIKLQLINLENLLLREYKDGANFRFNAMEAVIIPDKINFENDEPITGTISMMAYSTELEIKAKVNGADVMGSGKVPFKIDQVSVKGQDKLTLEILFPNKVYTSSLNLKRK